MLIRLDDYTIVNDEEIKCITADNKNDDACVLAFKNNNVLGEDPYGRTVVDRRYIYTSIDEVSRKIEEAYLHNNRIQ